MNMPKPRFSKVILTLLPLLLWGPILQAEETPFWPYDRLSSESDLVVVAVPVSSEDTGELLFSPLWQMDFVGVNTKVEVRGVVDGRFRAKELTIFHLRMPDGKTLVNGPLMLELHRTALTMRTAGHEKGQGAPEYLLYLKKRKDGRYEPASGPLSGGHAARELYPLPTTP